MLVNLRSESLEPLAAGESAGAYEMRPVVVAENRSHIVWNPIEKGIGSIKIRIIEPRLQQSGDII